jgi:hypothetical protein
MTNLSGVKKTNMMIGDRFITINTPCISAKQLTAYRNQVSHRDPMQFSIAISAVFEANTPVCLTVCGAISAKTHPNRR